MVRGSGVLADTAVAACRSGMVGHSMGPLKKWPRASDLSASCGPSGGGEDVPVFASAGSAHRVAPSPIRSCCRDRNRGTCPDPHTPRSRIGPHGLRCQLRQRHRPALDRQIPAAASAWKASLARADELGRSHSHLPRPLTWPPLRSHQASLPAAVSPVVMTCSPSTSENRLIRSIEWAAAIPAREPDADGVVCAVRMRSAPGFPPGCCDWRTPAR
jgi:hypothetical protein